MCFSRDARTCDVDKTKSSDQWRQTTNLGFDTLEKTERASKIPASTRKNTWTDIWTNAEAEAIPSAATAWAESANNSVATKVKRLLVEATTSNDAAIAASTAISVLLFLL